jgi:hypothetical protein
MITAVFTLEKTGTDPWGYYTNPENYLTDGYPSYCAQLSAIMPYYSGDKAKEMFPTHTVIFETVSPQKLLIHWESSDSDTIVAWWDYYTGIDIHDCYYMMEELEKIGKPHSANPGLIGVLQLLYPGEDVSLELEFTSVTEDFTKTIMYDYFKEHPYINTPTM